MLCDICQQNEAVIHYSEVVNGIKKEKHLCGNCAKAHMEKLFFTGTVKDCVNSIEFFSSGFGTQIKPQNEDENNIVCKACGTTLSQLRKNGKFGCRKCYESFADYLPDMFRRIQGMTYHVGKHPFGAKPFDPSTIASEEPLEDIHGRIMKEALSEASEQLMPGPEEKKKRSREKEYNEAEGTDARAYINSLRKELMEALAEEDYTTAAHIRDRIKELERTKDVKPGSSEKNGGPAAGEGSDKP